MTVSRILAIDISGERITICKEGYDSEYRRHICHSCIIKTNRIFLTVWSDMITGIYYYVSADFSIDEIFQILEVAIVGEVDFIGEHAF